MILSLKQKLDEVKLYANTYWKSAKQANQMIQEYETIKHTDKYPLKYKEQILKE
jgi:hypothetical protein